MSFSDLSRDYPGDPEPDVIWLKDGKRIKPKKHDTRVKIDWDISSDMYFLEIQNASKGDQGTYEVVVTNDKGEMRSTFVLTFHEAKEVNVIEEQIDIEEATSVESSAREAVTVSEQKTVKTTRVTEEVTTVVKKGVKDNQETEEIVEEVKEGVVESQSCNRSN